MTPRLVKNKTGPAEYDEIVRGQLLKLAKVPISASVPQPGFPRSPATPVFHVSPQGIAMISIGGGLLVLGDAFGGEFGLSSGDLSAGRSTKQGPAIWWRHSGRGWRGNALARSVQTEVGEGRRLRPGWIIREDNFGPGTWGWPPRWKFQLGKTWFNGNWQTGMKNWPFDPAIESYVNLATFRGPAT